MNELLMISVLGLLVAITWFIHIRSMQDHEEYYNRRRSLLNQNHSSILELKTELATIKNELNHLSNDIEQLKTELAERTELN